MKITLIFLACFVSLSYQQRWVSYPVPRELVYPGYFYQGNPYLQSFNNFASFNPEDLNGDESDAEGRISSNKLSQSAAAFPKSFLFPNRLWSLTTLLSQSTSTSTVFTAVTASTTVVTVQSCISTGLFASAVAAGPWSTTPCVRRRRDILEDLIEKPDIAPSKVESLVPTLLAVEQSDSIIPEISSSLSAPNDESVSRKSRALTVVVTTTSTFTSFSFSVTTVKKFFALAGAGNLLCLPNGYTVC